MTAPISRRMFFALGASVVVVACSSNNSSEVSTPVTTQSPPTTSPIPVSSLASDPFTLGVASGDPTDKAVVLWTRLATDPLNGGGMTNDDVDVLWEVSSSDKFGDVLASGVVSASAEHAHSLHIDTPLQSGTDWVYYRFRTGAWTSPIGRTRLAAPSGSTAPVTIAAASCQNWTNGFYNAYGDIVEQSPDVVLFLGDYIYESGPGDLSTGDVRLHNSEEVKDLDAYRNRYALYKSDLKLRRAHQQAPWIVIWDDHEVENNYANVTPQDEADTVGYAARRAAAYKAWWEHMPVRLEAPTDKNLKIYRQFSWGDLLNMLVLDGRQYRDDQACNDAVLETTPACDQASLPERTMLGAQQEQWLSANIKGGNKVWNVVANQTVMTDIRLGEAILNFDQWDGYDPDRQRILQNFVDQNVSNLIVLTGDIHLGGVGQLTTEAAPTTAMGIEFVSTSISSSGLVSAQTEGLLIALPNIIDAEVVHRGYTLHTITSETWIANYRIVADNTIDGSTVSTWKTFEVASGTSTVNEV